MRRASCPNYHLLVEVGARGVTFRVTGAFLFAALLLKSTQRLRVYQVRSCQPTTSFPSSFSLWGLFPCFSSWSQREHSNQPSIIQPPFHTMVIRHLSFLSCLVGVAHAFTTTQIRRRVLPSWRGSSGSGRATRLPASNSSVDYNNLDALRQALEESSLNTESTGVVPIQQQQTPPPRRCARPASKAWPRVDILAAAIRRLAKR